MNLDDIVSVQKVVTYHKVQNLKNFERQLDVIAAEKAILTVDDGDISFYSNVYPLVREYQIPTILFLITSLIGTDKPFWWDEVIYYLGEAQGQKHIKQLKLLPNAGRCEQLEAMRKNSNLPQFRYPQLTLGQLKEMQSNGIMMGNHSHTHPMLDQCTDNEIREELVRTKDFFHRNGVDGYSLFAYPNGNYSMKIQKILMEEGIKAAFLFDHRLNKSNNPMLISRLSVNDNTSVPKLKFILSGWHSRIVPVTRQLNRLFS